ncbi:MAG: sensor histidine kinase [Tenacibaculum sp.]
MKFIQHLFFIFLLIIATKTTAQINSLKNYNQKNGLPTNNITNVMQDNLGYLWFSSPKGISRFDGGLFENFTSNNGLISNQTTQIIQRNDTLIIGTNKGVSLKTPTKIISFEGKKINCILKTKKHTFLGTEKGIYRVREDFLSPIRTNFQIDLNKINDLKFDGTHFWIATNKSLWKLDKLINPTTLKRIDVDNYTSILIDKKNCIATTSKNGVKLIKNNTVKTISNTPVNITNIVKIDTEFWIISKNNGIEVLDANYNFERSINKYNTLTTNQINTAFQDKQKNIWITTKDKGIYKITAKNKTPLKPTLSFNSIDVLYKPIDSININNYTKTLSLSPYENYISFKYKTVNINSPNKIKYRYKLNNTFSPWTTKNSVDFANLQAGSYKFTAQSKVNNLESKPIQFQFYIDTPIYKKDWFLWLIIAITTLLFVSITYAYTRKIKAKNKAKIEKLELKNHLLSLEQKALQLQMNPHFIFNVLNGIKALGNSGKSIQLNNTISKFASLLRGILQHSRQEEISLSDEIAMLKNYIDLEQEMSSNPFTYTINTNLNIDTEEILIPPMLLQPFIENSIKHGIKSIKNGEITINFTTQNQLLHCSITDNGIGLQESENQKKSENHNSVAIKVTKERIKTLSKKNNFKLMEVKNDTIVLGTQVSFNLPLKTDF